MTTFAKNTINKMKFIAYSVMRSVAILVLFLEITLDTRLRQKMIFTEKSAKKKKIWKILKISCKKSKITLGRVNLKNLSKRKLIKKKNN